MEQFVLLAKYNQWMNQSIYEACTQMGQARIEKDQGVFFSSILNTLNHLLIGDIFWLSRCSGNKAHFDLKAEDGSKIFIKGLDHVLYSSIGPLQDNRIRIDSEIIKYINGLSKEDLSEELSYQTAKGEKMTNRLDVILQHWFNHQTHHRGQITAMMSQQGFDYGITDLIIIKDQL